jgi:2,5-diketo-D-gluconate reductase A
MSSVPAIELNDGRAIPRLGFGVFQIDPAETARAVETALEIGYRHIDTAEMYRNEQGVGDAVRASGLDRADVFITSKLDNGFHRPDDARRAFDRTLSALGSDYVDLFLIHWPLPTLYDGDFESTWKVNQIELHPYFLNDAVRAYGEAHGIATEAWSPIAQGEVLGDPVITAIAERLGSSPAQVVLRWHLQRGNIVFPKSTTPARIRENFALFDFELEPADMERIAALDAGEAGRTGANPDVFAFVPPDTALT